jgi:hypothetical protein
MKIETQREIVYEKLNQNKNHKCDEHISFNEYLENTIKKDIEEFEEKQKSDEIKRTSVFAEKKTGRRTTDIFDTLIDI